MSERGGLLQVFNIDPTPTPMYVPQTPHVIHPHVSDIRYDGWMDNTYLFVLCSGREAVAVDVNMSTLEELDGVLYDIHTRTTTTRIGMPRGVSESTTKDVLIYI